MIRVVLDTNILVSALLQPQGLPARIFLMTLAGTAAQLCVSGDVYAEYEEVIRRPKFKRSEAVIEQVDRLLETWPTAAVAGEAWREHDASELVARKPFPGLILIDQGAADPYLKEQLLPEKFSTAAAKAGQKLNLRMQPAKIAAVAPSAKPCPAEQA